MKEILDTLGNALIIFFVIIGGLFAAGAFTHAAWGLFVAGWEVVPK